jgi:hypothetical protein
LKNNKNIDISLVQLGDILKDEQGQRPQMTDLDKTEAALIAFAQEYAQKPPLSMRDRILEKIQKLDAQAKNRQPFTLDNLPILTADANWLDWEAAVEGIEPPEEYDNIHLHTLESNDTRELFIAWVQELVPEEVHDDLLESFVLLDGTCECHIWTKNGEKRFLRMQAGDYLELKIGEIHDIYTTSCQPVKAILQWLKVAA